MTDRALTVEVASTHLYPGARLLLPAGDAGAMIVAFSDGQVADAELLHDERGRPALHVSAYRTSTGSAIPAKLWPVREVSQLADGQVVVRLGRAVPG